MFPKRQHVRESLAVELSATCGVSQTFCTPSTTYAPSPPLERVSCHSTHRVFHIHAQDLTQQLFKVPCFSIFTPKQRAVLAQLFTFEVTQSPQAG